MPRAILLFFLCLPSFAHKGNCDLTLFHEGLREHLLVLAAHPGEFDAASKALEPHTEIVGELKPGPFKNLNPPIDIASRSVGDQRLSLAYTAINQIATATRLTSLLYYFQETAPVTQILLIGVGGSLSAKLEVGSVILANKIISHETVAVLDQGTALMEQGGKFVSGKTDQLRPILEPDADLTQWLAALLKPKLMHSHRSPVISGPFLSGQAFLGTPESKKRALETTSETQRGVAIDMESFATAYVAQQAGIPIAVAKVIVDEFQPEGGIKEQYRNEFETAAGIAAEIPKAIIESWEADETK